MGVPTLGSRLLKFIKKKKLMERYNWKFFSKNLSINWKKAMPCMNQSSWCWQSGLDFQATAFEGPTSSICVGPRKNYIEGVLWATMADGIYRGSSPYTDFWTWKKLCYAKFSVLELKAFAPKIDPGVRSDWFWPMYAQVPHLQKCT